MAIASHLTTRLTTTQKVRLMHLSMSCPTYPRMGQHMGFVQNAPTSPECPLTLLRGADTFVTSLVTQPPIRTRKGVWYSRFRLRLNMRECVRQCVWACGKPPASRKCLVEVYLDKIMNSEACVSDHLSHAPVRNVPTHARTFKRKRN